MLNSYKKSCIKQSVNVDIVLCLMVAFIKAVSLWLLDNEDNMESYRKLSNSIENRAE